MHGTPICAYIAVVCGVYVGIQWHIYSCPMECLDVCLHLSLLFAIFCGSGAYGIPEQQRAV